MGGRCDWLSTSLYRCTSFLSCLGSQSYCHCRNGKQQYSTIGNSRCMYKFLHSFNHYSKLSLNILYIFVLFQVARRIPPRVDDVVRSLYPPLDARLLEARVAALVLAVTHLALVTKHGVPKSQARKLTFIDQALKDMDSHLLILRNAALAQEAVCSIPASTSV